MADLEPLADPQDIALVRDMIEKHLKYTQSVPAQKILASWDAALAKFKKVMPRDYRRVLLERKRKQAMAGVGP